MEIILIPLTANLRKKQGKNMDKKKSPGDGTLKNQPT